MSILIDKWSKAKTAQINYMGAGQSFLENVETRRAVKRFTGGSVDSEPIEKAIVNAPSSFGTQPYKIYAVKSKTLKAALRKVSYDQAQVTECDTLYIFCARSDVEKRADEYIKATGANDGLRQMIMGAMSHIPDKTAWSAKQAYIALGFALAAAAEQEIASCPMEGFQSVEVAKLLKLPKNLTPCVYLAVGVASEEEEQHPRFRFPKEDLIEVII